MEDSCNQHTQSYGGTRAPLPIGREILNLRGRRIRISLCISHSTEERQEKKTQRINNKRSCFFLEEEGKKMCITLARFFVATAILVLATENAAAIACNETASTRCEINMTRCVVAPDNDRCRCLSVWRSCLESAECYTSEDEKELREDCIVFKCPPELPVCGNDTSSSSSTPSSSRRFGSVIISDLAFAGISIAVVLVIVLIVWWLIAMSKRRSDYDNLEMT